MPSLFGVDIAGAIGDALGPELLSATLHKTSAGSRTPGSLTGGNNPTETGYAAKGVVDDYSDREVDGTNIRVGDRRVLLLASTIASAQVPDQGDAITIEGTRYEVVGPVKRDPAAAMYLCQVRGV